MEIWSKCDICGRDIPVGELCYGLKKGNCICKDCCTGFENCTFTLAPAPTLTPPNEWVSVDENLPDFDVPVLVYVKDIFDNKGIINITKYTITYNLTNLSTLQTKNAQLSESRDHWKRLAHELSEGVNGKDAEHERLRAENEKLRELGSLRREVSALRERLAADEWIDPAVELPPNDDRVLAIVSGEPADNILLEDAYELASYGSDGWIVEQFELWEAPKVTWWRPLPDPPEKKKEER